jgi:hypothetical protein
MARPATSRRSPPSWPPKHPLCGLSCKFASSWTVAFDALAFC